MVERPIQVAIYGATKPYRSALLRCLDPYRYRVVEEVGPGAAPSSARRRVGIVYLDTDSDWAKADELCRGRRVTVVGITPDLSLERVVKALALGCDGVVHADTSEEIIANVVDSAVHGEVVLPSAAATILARAYLNQVSVSHELEPDELLILQRLAEGSHLAGIAGEVGWSERTLRRRMQSIFLTLGVSNRSQAVAKAGLLGLIEL